MYCRRCGKEMDYVAEICLDCQRELLGGTAAAEEKRDQSSDERITADPVVSAPQPAPAPEVPAKVPGSKMGRALASTIMGVISGIAGYVFGFITLLVVLAGGSGETSTKYGLLLNWGGMLAMSIVALVLGIKSVIHYNKCRKEFGKKYVATLVLGIVGIVASSFGLYMSSVLFSVLA